HGDTLGGDRGAELLVERFCFLRRCGVREARPVPLAGVRDERELAHDQRRAADVLDAAVELARLTLEDPQPRNLAGQTGGLRCIVTSLDPEQDTDPAVDLPVPLAVDPDPRLRGRLTYGAQACR